MQSQTIKAAVPAAADVWSDVEEFVIPAGVNMLKDLILSLAPDFGASGTNRYALVIRLTGGGLLEQSPHEYIATCGNVTLATSGAGAVEPNNNIYNVNLPVVPGGRVMVQMNTLDEAVTAGTVRVGATYSSESAPSGNHQAQILDAAMATTEDLWASVGTITIPVMAEAESPKRIKKLHIGCATDQAALALLRCSLRIRLTGAGIAEGGDHEYLGPASGVIAATPGVVTYDKQLVSYDVDIPVNAGGQIDVEQILDVETPTAGTVVIGFEYE